MILVDHASAVMDETEFDKLGEYSCSMPTGTTVGRRWKRGPAYNATANGGWLLGEWVRCGTGDNDTGFAEHCGSDKEHVHAKWRDILGVDFTPPAPPCIVKGCRRDGTRSFLNGRAFMCPPHDEEIRLEPDGWVAEERRGVLSRVYRAEEAA